MQAGRNLLHLIADPEFRFGELYVNQRIEVEGELAQRGRVLLRPSGTEPLLRVMVEGEDAGEVLAAAEDLATVVRDAAN